VSCGVGCRHGCGIGFRHSLDLELLWLWCRLAAIATTGSIAWELPYAQSVALKRKKKKKSKEVNGKEK